MVLRKWDIYLQKTELDPSLVPFAEINLKHMKDLHVVSKTVKILKENLGTKLLDSGLCNEFLYMTPKEQTTKAKNK